jgi:dCTP deaminase
MILTGPEIRRQHEQHRITIDPFDAGQLNPNSYDFRLGDRLKFYTSAVLDPRVRNPVEEMLLPDDGFVLEPGRIYLGHTFERMGSDQFVPIIRGKSSIARLGLFVHVTADLIDVGSHNQWTLQLNAVHPIRLYPRMRIGQVTFWTIMGEITLYKGKYQGTVGPCESMAYLDYKPEGVPETK